MPLLARSGLTLLVAASGGWIMWTLDMPLAWLLGAMAATGLGAILGLPLALPMAARVPMLAVIGAMLGSSFTAEVLAQAGGWLVSLAGLVAFIFAAGAACFLYFRRIAGFDLPTLPFRAGASGPPSGRIPHETGPFTLGKSGSPSDDSLPEKRESAAGRRCCGRIRIPISFEKCRSSEAARTKTGGEFNAQERTKALETLR